MAAAPPAAASGDGDGGNDRSRSAALQYLRVTSASARLRDQGASDPCDTPLLLTVTSWWFRDELLARDTRVIATGVSDPLDTSAAAAAARAGGHVVPGGWQ